MLRSPERPRRPPVSRFVLLLYDAVFLIAFLFYSPIVLLKMIRSKAYRVAFRERTGRLPILEKRPRIWLHGVSVGEIKAAQPLVHAIQDQHPGIEIVVSATTPTGRAEAERLYPELRVIYYPLDFGPFPGRALDRIQPDLLLLMELELWPGLLNAAERRRIPVVVVNGRISQRSFRGYGRVSWLLPQLDRIDLFCVQNEIYAERIRSLGVPEDKIQVTGNLKYEAIQIQEEGVEAPTDLIQALAIGTEDIVLVGGSTHSDEEEKLARVTLELENRSSRKFRLIVAPRHANERGGAARDDLLRVLQKEGDSRDVLLWTELRAGRSQASEDAWLVVDTIGELERVYKMAHFVFVGGSLIPHGGQNMLEPVALGKPTFFGPHVANFQTDVEFLLEVRGAIQIRDEAELVEKLLVMLEDPAEAQGYVERAWSVLRENKGATERSMSCLRPLIEASVTL